MALKYMLVPGNTHYCCECILLCGNNKLLICHFTQRHSRENGNPAESNTSTLCDFRLNNEPALYNQV